MNLWNLFILVWLPLGRIYVVVYEVIAMRITIKEILTSPTIHKQIINAGFGGLATPLLHYIVHRPNYMKKYKKKPPPKKNISLEVADINKNISLQSNT